MIWLKKTLICFGYINNKNELFRHRIRNVILLFFNKTTKDILWHDELNRLQAQYSDK